jgi:hypothetical protein
MTLAKNIKLEAGTILHEQRKNETKYILLHIRAIKMARAIHF